MKMFANQKIEIKGETKTIKNNFMLCTKNVLIKIFEKKMFQNIWCC